MDFLNKLGKKASETYQFTKEKTNKISEELKLKNRINENKNKIQEIFAVLGENAYQEFVGGEKSINVEEKCNEITALKEEISRTENELLSIKNLKKCSNCGTEMPKDSQFCSKCGTKQPEEIKEEVEVKEAEVVDPEENKE